MALEIAKRASRIFDMMQHAIGMDHVEAFILQSERTQPRKMKRARLVITRAHDGSRNGKIKRRYVEQAHLIAALGIHKRVKPEPAAEIQNCSILRFVHA